MLGTSFSHAKRVLVHRRESHGESARELLIASLTKEGPRSSCSPGALSREGLCKGWQLKTKTAFDFVGAFALLILLSPVLLLVSVLIKLTSSGPVIFKQERVGLAGRPFLMWKFRTMELGAEQLENEFRARSGGLFFKPKDDPRVTMLGPILRKYSLDELPQLLNVLRGEMSLVGPRPIRDFELERFTEPAYYRRFGMKPGLTCIWQVNGRNHTSDTERILQDLEYVDNWTLLMDLELLLKTFPAVFKGDGAW